MKYYKVLVLFFLAVGTMLIANGIGLGFPPVDVDIFSRLPIRLELLILLLLLVVSTILVLARISRNSRSSQVCYIIQTRRGTEPLWVKKAYSDLSRALQVIAKNGGEATYTIDLDNSYAKLVLKGSPSHFALIEDRLRELSHTILYAPCSAFDTANPVCYIYLPAGKPGFKELISPAELASKELVIVDWKGELEELKEENISIIDLGDIVSTHNKINTLKQLSAKILEGRDKETVIVVYNPLEAVNTRYEDMLLEAIPRKIAKAIIVLEEDIKPRKIPKCAAKSLRI